MVLPDKINKNFITGVATVVFGAVLVWWLAGSHYPAEIVERVPGMDNRPKIVPRPDTVVIGEFFDTINQVDDYAYGNWPHFRGPYFDNINHDTIPLAESWDTTGPPVAWKLTLGEGYAGPAVYDGKVYIMDWVYVSKLVP